ncbi:MarR family winged helix-turn-helix transcriptional regulator [Salinarimonas soli]|uniref:MarR family transcriptional regulator n=1 Tax=Salinarimonas soli TaxID=1638099 RepID=A0A5B2VE77_9HYPH|nr:MarR family transcriptional regulator [Salinarimonas soli]KAA2236467.1 MarR family transcriptional regulator [Salinarimonas soli]
MTRDQVCACTTLRRITRRVTAAYDNALAPSGLRVTQFALLRILERSGDLSVVQLARAAALDRSTMGRNLDPLERRGLVAMRVGSADQRERIVTLTEEGSEAIKAATPYWRKAQAEVATLVDPSLIRALAEQPAAGLGVASTASNAGTIK